MTTSDDTASVAFRALMRANNSRGEHYEDDAPEAPAPDHPPVRLFAFYLPQFHPIPENDLWWGKGFTEWTNVTKALPQFEGHRQPCLPGELGFYDLRLPDVLRRQAGLARKYGIEGFCIYTYWFAGRRLLERPLDTLLAHPDIDMPFCVCWANENWSRRWDGGDADILIEQSHSAEDDVAFAQSLEPLFADPRYLRIEGRPVLVVYRPGLLPNPAATARRWRSHFARAGLGNPYLVMAQCFGDEDPRLFGFDAACEFPPHKIGHLAPRINDDLRIFDASYQGNVYDYADLVDRAAHAPPAPYTLFPAVCPSWDNEARRPGRGSTFAFSTPALYRRWLDIACRRAARQPKSDERLVFINAWNEWAEAAYLEPDRHFGYAYLHQTARVLREFDMRLPPAAALGVVVVVHDAHANGAQLLALNLVRVFVRQFGIRVHVLLAGPGVLADAFRDLAPTESLHSQRDDPDLWTAAARRLAEQGFTIAFCNTLVAAPAIGPLREAGLTCIALVHELPSLIRAYSLSDAARIAAENAHACVFASAFVRDRFTEVAGGIAGTAIVRPQGIFRTLPSDSELASLRAAGRERLGIPAGVRLAMGAGIGDPRKGLDFWPDIIAAVLARAPDTVFLWAGWVQPDLMIWLRHDLERLGIADRLLFAGQVDDMAPLYAAADVFLLTSREDPFPSVVLEAMAHGLPVVVFENAGGIVDLVRSVGGIAVPYRATAMMADAVAALLADNASRAVAGQAGRRRMQRDFGFADYGFDLLRLAVPKLRRVSVILDMAAQTNGLQALLTDICAQTYPLFEIILLGDDTAMCREAIAELNRISGRTLRSVFSDGAAETQRLSAGVEAALGELIWTPQAGSHPAPDFVAAAIDDAAIGDGRSAAAIHQRDSLVKAPPASAPGQLGA